VSEPTQWAIKQHIEKNPMCEMICLHTSKHNLGEDKPSDCSCNARAIRSDCVHHGEAA
jgi:hypothetical protein